MRTGTPDNITGVSYGTQPRAWMDRTCFNQWLNEPKAISGLENEQRRVLFVDNASGHNVTPQIQ